MDQPKTKEKGRTRRNRKRLIVFGIRTVGVEWSTNSNSQRMIEKKERGKRSSSVWNAAVDASPAGGNLFLLFPIADLDEERRGK